MPKISVVIPVYNVEDYLAKCVDSVLAQDFQDYEVILVNDGSTDGSLKIAQEYERGYEKVRLISQENKGLGGARNTGILNATGEYICFIDSDDAIAPDTLATLAEAVDRLGCDIAVFDIEYVNENGTSLTVQRGMDENLETFDLVSHRSLLFCVPSACNKLIRRTLFTENQILFPDRVWFEDIRTITKLYPYASKMCYIPKPFYRYLQRADSIMHSAKVARNAEIMDALADVIAYYKEHGYYDMYCRELEFLLIENAYVLASFRVLRQDPKNPLLAEFHAFLQQYVPDYASNPYLSRLSAKNKLIYQLLLKKCYGLLHFMDRVQAFLRTVKRGGNR